MAENEASLEDEAALLRRWARKHRQDAENTETYLDANRSTMNGEAIEEFTGAALLNETQADECDRLAVVLQAAVELVGSRDVAIAEARAAGKADGLGEDWETVASTASPAAVLKSEVDGSATPGRALHPRQTPRPEAGCRTQEARGAGCLSIPSSPCGSHNSDDIDPCRSRGLACRCPRQDRKPPPQLRPRRTPSLEMASPGAPHAARFLPGD